MTEKPGLFAGLRVLDCASFIAGPAAATIMSDFGADVIKIEPPGEGDSYRWLGARPGGPVTAHDFASLLTSRNKRSLALDLKTDAGQAVLRRLVAGADVFLTNYPLPVRDRLKLTYEDLQGLNPRLIYAGMSAYGEIGPEAGKTGFDATAYWARSGLMDLVRVDADAMPARSTAGMGDHPTSLALYGAIVMALYRREKTGLGGKVSSSLLASGLYSNGYMLQAVLVGAAIPPRQPREIVSNALAGMYHTLDKRWLSLAMLAEERQWPALPGIVGRPELLDDPRFVSNATRRANARVLFDILDRIFPTRTLADWRAALDAGGITFGIVSTTDEAAHDDQAHLIGAIRPFADRPGMTIDSPIILDGEEKTVPRQAPEVGQHSVEILAEAGYAVDEIDALLAAKVIAS